MMRFLRRLHVALGLGLHRAHVGGARSLLVLAGVAAAAALLAGVFVGALVARERALERSVESLAPSVRSVRVAWFGLPGRGDAYDSLDRDARAVVDGGTKTVLFRESTIAGRFAALGAVDGLARWVRVTSGRLPRTCDEQRCEVVQLRGDGPLPHGFVAVGRGRLRSTMLFGDAVPADRNELDRSRLAPRFQRIERYHQPPPPPLLLGGDVRALLALPVVRSTYRSYGWVDELRSDEVRPWKVTGLLGRLARARSTLQTRSTGFELVVPFEELVDARDRTAVAARRLSLLGGQGVALLLAFAGFAATRLRRPAQAADRRLVLLGVPTWQRTIVTVTQASVLAIAGVAAAWVAAVAVTSFAAGWPIARNALLVGHGAAATAALALASAAVVAVTLAVRPSVRTGVLDVLAVVLAALVVVALARGAADVDELLNSGSSGVLLLALPMAVIAIGGFVTAPLLAPPVRAFGRRVPAHA